MQNDRTASIASHRVLVSVDGQNLLGQLRSAACARIDARAFVAWCRFLGRPTVRWAQGCYPGNPPFFARLEAAGIEVITKVPKRFPDGTTKADMDMELGVDAMESAPHFGRVLLVTADGDFVPLVAALRRSGCEVHLLSRRTCTARELLAAIGDECFHDLDRALDSFGFTPRRAA